METTMTITLAIAGAEIEREAVVTYDYSPAQRAIFYSPAYAVGPAMEAVAEVASVKIGAVDVLPLLDADTVSAIEETLIELTEDTDDGDEADRAHDEWRDRQMEERA